MDWSVDHRIPAPLARVESVLLGLNDAEWDALPDWTRRVVDPAGYDAIFEPVEMAPALCDLGAGRLDRILAAGRAAVRDDEAWKPRRISPGGGWRMLGRSVTRLFGSSTAAKYLEIIMSARLPW